MSRSIVLFTVFHLSTLTLLGGCNDTTGGALVDFAAAAAGPISATGGTLTFDNAIGYHVVLSKATLHIGALYLNQSVPTSGAQGSSCILPGIYVGEVLVPLDVDVLSPVPQPFSADGSGTSLTAAAGEVWLTGGDINASDDPTVILTAAGTATKAAVSYPFTAQITIGQNRALPVLNTAEPGANPICKQRIVTPIPIDLTLAQGGTLLVRVDPSWWFLTVDFSTIPADPDNAGQYLFSNTNNDTADISLYDGMHDITGAYTFSFQ